MSKLSMLCYLKGRHPLGYLSSERFEVNLTSAKGFLFCFAGMGHSIWRLTVNPILFMFYFYHENFWTSPTNNPNRFKYLRRRCCFCLFVCLLVFVCFLVFFCSFVSGRLAASTHLVQLMLMNNCSLSGCIPVSRQQCNGELSVDVRVCSNNTALGACWGNNWKITQRKKSVSWSWSIISQRCILVY